MTMVLEQTDKNPITINPPRKGTRQAQLVALLQRMNWQAHTARAALTGLRKRGYQIERMQEYGKNSRYVIRISEVE